ncbi:hypothetical protein TNCV_841 [Trichonephila clavipes]|nr:hypothetical protein TNCV_841 [Trichonephila clavipes]
MLGVELEILKLGQVTSTTRAAGLQWYWAQTHDMPAMIRYLDHWATVATMTRMTSELTTPFSNYHTTPGEEY